MRVNPEAGVLEGLDEFPGIPETDPGLESAVSTMPDHSKVD